MGIAVTSGLALLFFVLFFCQCRKSREGTLFYTHHNHLSISMILRFFDCITRHLPYFLFVKWMFHLTDFHFWLNFVFWRKGNRDHYNTPHETTGYLDVQHLERPVVHAHAGNGEINLYPYQTNDTWITWFFSRSNSMLELFFRIQKCIHMHEQCNSFLQKVYFLKIVYTMSCDSYLQNALFFSDNTFC